jgi:hypothetical protein
MKINARCSSLGGGFPVGSKLMINGYLSNKTPINGTFCGLSDNEFHIYEVFFPGELKEFSQLEIDEMIQSVITRTKL